MRDVVAHDVSHEQHRDEDSCHGINEVEPVDLVAGECGGEVVLYEMYGGVQYVCSDGSQHSYKEGEGECQLPP